jgi:hypothetical protein
MCQKSVLDSIISMRQLHEWLLDLQQSPFMLIVWNRIRLSILFTTERLPGQVFGWFLA